MYSVPPFSGPRFSENQNICRIDKTPCAICGKGVSEPWPHSAEIIAGGTAWADDPKAGPGDHVGLWPIGRDCHRKYFLPSGGCEV